MMKLKCPACSAPLSLKVTYTGPSKECMAGEQSDFGYPLSLRCTSPECGLIFELGYLFSGSAFSPVVEELQPYQGASGFVVTRSSPPRQR